MSHSSLLCFCSLLCVHVHVLTPGWSVTKNTYWAALLVLKATLIHLFLVASLGVHWYCFLKKCWAKSWLSLLVRSHCSSALSHESQNSSFVIEMILSLLLLTECLKFEGCRVRMTSLEASQARLVAVRGCEEGGWLCEWAVGKQGHSASNFSKHQLFCDVGHWEGWSHKLEVHILLVICVVWFSVFQLNLLSKFKEKIWKVTQKEWWCLLCSNWIFALS